MTSLKVTDDIPLRDVIRKKAKKTDGCHRLKR